MQQKTSFIWTTNIKEFNLSKKVNPKGILIGEKIKKESAVFKYFA